MSDNERPLTQSEQMKKFAEVSAELKGHVRKSLLRRPKGAKVVAGEEHIASKNKD